MNDILNMPKTILVTGATGTVGGEVVKQLSRDASNYNIKAGIHSIENAKKIQQYDRVKAVQIDYDKQEGLESAFKDSDKLFMQNFVNFYSQTIKEQGAFYLPAEDAKVNFVDARDIASVAVKALVDEDKNYNKTYMVTGPEGLSYHQAAEILSNATGKKIDYVNISEEETREALKKTGMDDWLISTILGLYKLYRKGYASEVSSAVEEVTGRKATTFVEFATDHADAFR